jgi:predicted SprT family Zn-dependent metalloprotease
MAQTTPLKPNPFRAEYHFMDNESVNAKSGANCRCGNKSFREVHRIAQPKGGTSIMYECEKCGEYCL